MRSVRAGLWFVVTAAVLAGGCRPAGETVYDVSGTVTYDGKPVPAGLVFFDPDTSKGGPGGEQGYANIKDGKFNTAGAGRGIRSGPCRIRILGFDGKSGDDYPMGRPLFDEYAMRKDMPAAPSELSVNVPRKGQK